MQHTVPEELLMDAGQPSRAASANFPLTRGQGTIQGGTMCCAAERRFGFASRRVSIGADFFCVVAITEGHQASACPTAGTPTW